MFLRKTRNLRFFEEILKPCVIAYMMTFWFRSERSLFKPTFNACTSAGGGSRWRMGRGVMTPRTHGEKLWELLSSWVVTQCFDVGN